MALDLDRGETVAGRGPRCNIRLDGVRVVSTLTMDRNIAVRRSVTYVVTFLRRKWNVACDVAFLRRNRD